MDYKKFQNPPAEYRPAAFWSWNDDLAEDELQRQVDAFAEGGMGGFFMHARSGLRTPYLSRRWFRMVKACVDRAKEKGLHAWLYDEMAWPSGRAGGMVEALGTRNCVKQIVCAEAPVKGVLPRELLRSDVEGRTHVFYVDYGVGAEMLDPEAIKDFIEFTHELYNDNVSEEFGSSVPGIFFDEPQFASYYDGKDYVPYTERLFEAFQSRWGYDLLPSLPSLFYETGEYRKVRIHYWSLISDLYAEAFSEQIDRWCRAHGLISTGHHEWEDTLLGQLRCTASVQRQYEVTERPGTDHLGRCMVVPWIFIQAASVCAQLGKPRCMVECFGVAGQHFDMHDRRWIYGMLAVLGMNFFVPHLALYGMRGENKRDCPPHNLHQQPWWKYNALADESIARVSVVMTEGVHCPDLLVVNPITSAWSGYSPFDTAEVEALQQRYGEASFALLHGGICYDVGEETLMRRYARVEDGVLRVGEMDYRALVLPCNPVLLQSTLTLLREFAAAGGRIYACGTLPEYADGNPIGEKEMPEITLLPDAASLRERLRADLVFDADFDGCGKPVWVNRRRSDGRGMWLICNPDHDEAVNVKIRFSDPKHAVIRLCAVTGKPLPFKAAGVRESELALYGGEYALLVESEDVPEETSPVLGRGNTELAMPQSWRVTSAVHGHAYRNCANLDCCRFKWNDGPWSEPVYTREAAARFREENAAAPRHARGSFTLAFDFEVKPGVKKVLLAMEDQSEYGLYVNGERLCFKDAGCFIDGFFRLCDISAYISEGNNVVELCGTRRAPTEDIYLVGDFDVSLRGTERVLIPSRGEVTDTGDMTAAGYPFFAGELTFGGTVKADFDVKHARIEFPAAHAAVIRVRVNGREVPPLFAAPWTADLSGLLKRGDNDVEITLVNTLRNLLGPLHNDEGEYRSIANGQYYDKNHFTEQLQFMPLGFACRIYGE